MKWLAVKFTLTPDALSLPYCMYNVMLIHVDPRAILFNNGFLVSNLQFHVDSPITVVVYMYMYSVGCYI